VLREINFRLKIFVDRFEYVAFVERNYLHFISWWKSCRNSHAACFFTLKQQK